MVGIIFAYMQIRGADIHRRHPYPAPIRPQKRVRGERLVFVSLIVAPYFKPKIDKAIFAGGEVGNELISYAQQNIDQRSREPGSCIQADCERRRPV